MKKFNGYQTGEKIYSAKHFSTAMFFRDMALEIDQEPERIIHYLDRPFIDELVSDQDSNCLERTKMFESLAYGDPGVLLASPGPSLSGLMVRELGNEAQKEYFFKTLQKNRSRTCLAVTEPLYGSDASHMQTQFTTNKLNGQKWLVGNGATADMGVVIARQNKGPLGICSILLTPEIIRSKDIERVKLPMLALRGAQLSYLNFQDVFIDDQWVLGKELSAINRGMMAVIKTFNRMRPCVAALAVGLSQAVLEYLAEHKKALKWCENSLFNQLCVELSFTRKLLYSSAKSVDFDPMQSAVPSLAKIEATRLAEKIVSSLRHFLPAGIYMEHPLLLKWQRDAFGFEYMEGTENMQRGNILQPYVSKKKQAHDLLLSLSA